MMRSARIPASSIAVTLAGLAVVAGGPRVVMSQTPPAIVVTSLEHGLTLDFFRADDGTYLKVAPPGVRMSGFEVPAAGISVGGKIYLFCTTDHTPTEVMGRCVLVEFDEAKGSFRTVRDVSRRPGNFINVAPHLAPVDPAEWPGGEDPPVLIWGSGAYRRSHIYLSRIAAAQIEHPTVMRSQLRVTCEEGARSVP